MSPIEAIGGPNTGLDFPHGILVDSAGNIHVTNVFNNSVTVFAAGANGNATPIRTVAGSNTGLNESLQL